jgi:arginine-tRNA-protein transferase
MFARVVFPETLKPDELDHYLEQGWFRMGQSIFTTNFLNFNDQLYSAVWLRISLSRFSMDKTQQALMKRNAAFRTEIKKADISPLKEMLYSKYKQVVSFEASPSLHQLLFRNAAHSIYNTQEVNVYHGEKLIATGFFDIGQQSSAGIISIYDPAYKKYSLGKYLIYLKINHSIKQGMQYFYPGYFVPGYSFFDYKLAIGKPAIEYLHFTSRQWLPINVFSADQTPLQVMRNKLYELKNLLSQAHITSTIARYAYFDASLIPELKDAEMFDYPIFLFFTDAEDNHLYLTMIVYDLKDDRYHLIRCASFWKSPASDLNSEIYSSNLLKVMEYLFSTAAPEELVSLLSIKITGERKI